MPPRPAEGQPQSQLVLLLRYAVDTAIRYPTLPNIATVLAFVEEHPKAMRASYMRHNLGLFRWEWLGEHGVYVVGEPTVIAGMPAIKGTIEPEVLK